MDISPAVGSDWTDQCFAMFPLPFRLPGRDGRFTWAGLDLQPVIRSSPATDTALGAAIL